MRLPKAPDFRRPPVPRSRILLGASLAGVLALGTGAIVVTIGAVGPGEPDAPGASPLARSSPLAPSPDESMSAPAPDEDMVPPSPDPSDAADDAEADGQGNGADGGSGGGGGERPGPVSGDFFADPNAQVRQWIADNEGDGRQRLIAERIASQPQGVWVTDAESVTVKVRDTTSAAEATGEVPVLVSYLLPNRDCGGASAGGAPDLDSYDAWMADFAAGLGGGPVVVILEPDSIALSDCLSEAQRNARFAALSRAAATIHEANPQARVYFDGGHSNWHSPADMASWLAAAGVLENGDGIATNISNFRTTGHEATYARAVLAELGDPGLGAVIDTSRNGNGPLGDEWCDPGGRRLGRTPTTETGDPAIDAYLWIKPPGEADGCAATAGTFSPDLAFELAGGN